MSRPLELAPSKWYKLQELLRTQYPQSVMLISSRMRDVLGFTVRQHKKLVRSKSHNQELPIREAEHYETVIHLEHYETVIHLDFWNEPKRTMFLLKYGEFL